MPDNNTSFVSFKKGDYINLPAIKHAGTIYLSTNINEINSSNLFSPDNKDVANYTFLSVDLDNTNRVNLDAARAVYAHVAKTALTADALYCSQVGNDLHPVYFSDSGVPVQVKGLAYGSQYDTGVINKANLPKIENPYHLKLYNDSETNLLLSYDGSQEKIVKLIFEATTSVDDIAINLKLNNNTTITSALIPAATTTYAGVVDTNGQSFAGAKTFINGVHSQLFCVDNTSNTHKVQMVYNTNTESLDFNFV